jgi:MFS family permease
MGMKGFTERLGATPKVAAVAIILVANAFVWYTCAFSFLADTVTNMVTNMELSIAESAVIFGINFLGIAASAFLGSFLISKYKRRMNFLLYWMSAGIIFSLLPILIDNTSFTGLVVLATSLGVYFGLGMPTCMGYYSAATETGNRARLSGLIILSIGIGFFLLHSIGGVDVTLISLSLVTWRALGLISLVFLKPKEKPIDQKAGLSYRSIISDKPFLLYFIPWLMFSLVNDLTFPVNQNSFPETFISFSTMLENLLAGIVAVIGGFFADSVGRKRLTLAGFTLLGLGYAILGLFPKNFLGWWFYTTVDGIAWGVFSTIFLITVWGDLAQGQSSEKYYILGSLPYLLSNFTRVSLGSYVAATVSDPFAVFSFAAFFLFLAVLPVVYAPETLPEKTMKERELKKYVEKAQREAEKAQEKEAEKTQRENGDDGVEIEANQNLEEILKEAEKYY